MLFLNNMSNIFVPYLPQDKGLTVVKRATLPQLQNNLFSSSKGVCPLKPQETPVLEVLEVLKKIVTDIVQKEH